MKPVCLRAHALQLLKPALSRARVPQLLSPCAAATEAHALEPVLCNKRSHHNEKPVHCNEEMKSSPCSPQLEKAHAQQWRPNATKKKKKKKAVRTKIIKSSQREIYSLKLLLENKKDWK